jgi:hypothetical protein
MATPKALSGNPYEEAIGDAFVEAFELIAEVDSASATVAQHAIGSDLYDQLTDTTL